jgi:ParB-like chromosome segregation protein Spo0J
LTKPKADRKRSSTKEAIEWRPIDGLQPYDKNARKHPPEQIAEIRASFRKFGWVQPILITDKGEVIAGHARLEVAIAEGWKEAKCLVVTGMTKGEVRAYILADNQLALGGEWDEELLKGELRALERSNFDMAAVGFDAAELDRILERERAGDGPGEVPASSYKEQYGVIVICESEAHQAKVYDELVKQGRKVKVVAT